MTPRYASLPEYARLGRLGVRAIKPAVEDGTSFDLPSRNTGPLERGYRQGVFRLAGGMRLGGGPEPLEPVYPARRRGPTISVRRLDIHLASHRVRATIGRDRMWLATWDPATATISPSYGQYDTFEMRLRPRLTARAIRLIRSKTRAPKNRVPRNLLGPMWLSSTNPNPILPG